MNYHPYSLSSFSARAGRMNLLLLWLVGLPLPLILLIWALR